MQPKIAIKHFEKMVPKSFTINHYEGVSIAILSLGYTLSLRISAGYSNSRYIIELLNRERVIDELQASSRQLCNALFELLRRNNLSHLFSMV